MKIAYLVSAGVVAVPTSGVVKKIESHIREWERLGHEVRLFALVPPGADPVVVQKFAPGVILEDAPLRFKYLVLDILRRYQTSAKLAEAVDTWKPDLIYHRFGTFFPAFLKLQKNYPTVIEVNTDDVMELKLLQPLYKRAYRQFSRRKALRTAAGAVFLTHELAERQYFKEYVRKSTVIANGIDFGTYPEGLLERAAHNKEPQFVFIASPGLSWHGLDQLFELARIFPPWGFHVIGPKAPPRGIPKNVKFYGELSEDQYRPVLQKADFGIGSLASHRKKMSEACPLKVREYLAYGLPVILRDSDTDFPKEPWFVLRLPEETQRMADYAPIIRDFVQSAQSRRVRRLEIAHLDVKYKEKLRLDFFQKILEASR